MLIEALSFDHADVQYMACMVLLKLKLESITSEELQRVVPLVSARTVVASVAADLLSLYGGEGHRMLADLMVGDDPVVAVRAAIALLEGREDLDEGLRMRSIVHLRDALLNADGKAANLALNYLYNHSVPEILPWLRENARNDELGERRRSAVSVLVHQITRYNRPVTPQDYQLFVQLLGDKSVSIQCEALSAMHCFALTREAILAAIAMTDDPSEGLRALGVGFLCAIPDADEAIRAVIRRRLLDESDYVVNEAVQAVARLNDRDSLPMLVQLLAGPTDEGERLRDCQIRAGQLIAAWTGQDFKFDQLRLCGLGAAQAMQMKERGEKIGGEEGRARIELAKMMLMHHRESARAMEADQNRKFLAEREQLLAWWMRRGVTEFRAIPLRPER